jgi:hypothetical protein
MTYMTPNSSRTFQTVLTIVVALSSLAWGQAPAPSDAEASLRKRVAEFYALMKVKRTTDAEKYVTADTLDQFRIMPAGDFVNATIDSIAMAADKKSAAVMINLLVSSATVPVPFAFPRKTNWRLEADGWKIVIPAQTMESSGPSVMFPGGNKPAAPPKTDLTFAEPLLEIAQIKEGEKKLARFSFTNTGAQPVTIRDVLSDCKCIAWKSDKKTYKPGEKGEVVVEFDSTGLKYRYSQSLKVITSPGNQEIMLMLSANIAPAI